MADDIVVGSVAVDIVPDTRKFGSELKAKLQGVNVDVGVNADTSGVRAQIESASKTRPAQIRVKVDDAVAKTQLAKLQNELKDKTLALDLSTSAAKAKITALQAQVAEVKGNVDLDPTVAKAQIATLQAEVKTLRGKLEIDTAPARAAIGQLRAEIAAQKVTIKAQADTAVAETDLDVAARDRTSTIRANVDKSQVSAVGKLSGALGNIGVLGTSIITLGPALIPILAVVAGIGLALGAPLAVAAGGATVFGFLAGFAVKDTNKQLQAISKADAKLSGLTKGTAAYAAAQADLKAKQDALTPAQKKYADSLDHIKASFANFLGGKVGNELLGPVSAFLDLAAGVLPKLTPIIGAVSGALTSLLGDLGDAVKSPEFKAFVSAFADQVGPDIVSFGHIAGGVIKGFTGLIVGLGDAFGPGVLKGLQSLTDKFAGIGQQAGNSKKLKDFVDYFHRVGPQVGDTIGAVARAVGHIVSALAPLGPPALKVVEGIANAISAIPIPVLTALAASFVAMVAAAKVGKGLNSILGSGSGLGGRGGIASKLTGGLIGSVKPVPVFVVNEGFGGASGAGGGGGLGKLGTLGIGVTALGAVNAAGVSILRKEYGNLFGSAIADALRLPDPKTQQLGQAFFKKVFGAGIKSLFGGGDPKSTSTGATARFLLDPHLTSTTTKVDTLRSSLDKASNGFDIVGHSAHRNFGGIQADVRALQAKLDALHAKKLTIILDDVRAVRSLQALQAFRLKDKTLTINERERIVGPGGGIGHPLAPSTPSDPKAGSSGGGRGGVTYTGPITINAQDHRDLQRQMEARHRRAALDSVRTG